MKTMREILFSVLAVAAVVGAFTLPFWYEHQRQEESSKARTIVLTGVAPQGIWTQDEVTGANYSKGGFKPAQIRLEAGEQVHLVLRSADVVHSFYMPQLGIGPIQLIPGHTEVVNFKADKEGIYPFYCTSVCGNCHFHMLNMRGLVAIGKELPGGDAPSLDEPLCHVNISSDMPTFSDVTQKGHYLFQTRGCVTCHGADGVGGVPNFNYARGTVPALNSLATKISLGSKDEVEAFTKALGQNEELSKDKPVPGISNWLLTFAQYQSVVKTIEGGSPPLKADPNGPEPPLFMPSWKEILSGDQINSIIAFLVSEQKFEEHTGWGN
jgi:plastocyanin/mono/diheme cytochrome c family protein